VIDLILLLLTSLSLFAVNQKKPEETKAPPAPGDFAFTLSNGYGEGCRFSTDPKVFENLLVNMKKAGFNTIHCVWKDWRVPLCKKHGIRMMVDVLAWHEGAETDIRRNEKQRAAVRAICEKSRNDAAVWGYNIWNEKLAYFGYPDKKSIDDYILMIKKWDPTHPIWMGTYRVHAANGPKSKPGIHAYYDYHWQRGFLWHFADLQWYHRYVESQDGYIGRWMLGSDYNRNSYTLNTSIAFGLKVVIWFIGGPFDKEGNIDPKHRFHHLVKIGREMQHLYPEIGKIGRPSGVYSTPTVKTESNKDKKKDQPWRLPAFPEGHWLQVEKGEAVVGFFRDDTVYVANHNAYAPQEMVLKLDPGKAIVERFDRKTGAWGVLEKKDNKVLFDLRAAGGELLRVKGRKGE
jgi:hypothetical protein